MSKQERDHGKESWFAERDEARKAGGTVENAQAISDGNVTETGANPQEPADQNTGNRGIGQYSGQGVPPLIKK